MTNKKKTFEENDFFKPKGIAQRIITRDIRRKEDLRESRNGLPKRKEYWIKEMERKNGIGSVKTMEKKRFRVEYSTDDKCIEIDTLYSRDYKIPFVKFRGKHDMTFEFQLSFYDTKRSRWLMSGKNIPEWRESDPFLFPENYDMFKEHYTKDEYEEARRERLELEREIRLYKSYTTGQRLNDIFCADVLVNGEKSNGFLEVKVYDCTSVLSFYDDHYDYNRGYEVGHRLDYRDLIIICPNEYCHLRPYREEEYTYWGTLRECLEDPLFYFP